MVQNVNIFNCYGLIGYKRTAYIGVTYILQILFLTVHC